MDPSDSEQAKQYGIAFLHSYFYFGIIAISYPFLNSEEIVMMTQKF